MNYEHLAFWLWRESERWWEEILYWIVRKGRLPVKAMHTLHWDN